MNQTELKIISYNASGIVSNTWDVDLYDSVPMPINKSIIDIREPDKRQSDYSKSLTIPGTANNHSIFSAIFNLDRTTINTSELNFNPDFNPNLKADAILYRKGIPQLTGYIQLVSIKNVDGAIEYECVIIGKFANLFQDLGELNLSQLDLSDYNHIWNKTNVENSWDTSIVKNGTTYVNFNASGQPDGSGYVYPLIDRGNSVTSTENDYNLTTMYPAVYVKQVVDSIFDGAGYRYESEFFNSQRFKNLIIPFCGGEFRMTKEEVEDRDFLMTNSTDLSYTSTRQYNSEVFKIGFNVNGNDTNPSGVSTTNHEWTCPSGLGGNYRFALEGNITITNIGSGSCNFAFAFTRKRGTAINRFYIDYRASSGSGSTNPLKIESGLIDIQSGDKVYAECYYGALTLFGVTADARNFTITFESDFQFYSNPQANYQEGQTIDIVSALPERTKQTEFLQYLIKMFNLYVEVDKIDTKKLIIEPRDEFYLETFEDLTDYLDVSQELEIKPMGLLDFRVFEMSYKSDSDEFNKRYEDVYREPFSKQKFTINNDFIRDTKSIELGFSATPSVDSKTNDRIIPKIRPQDPSTDSANLPVYNIRILQYGGVVSSSQGWNLIAGGVSYNYTEYPYAGMLDKIVLPTFSLEVTTSKAYFYGTKPDITTANLYNSYWLKTITEITDKDSKLVSGYFHLSPNQLANLSFRKYYKIDKQFYRLHQVEYDLNSNDPVKIEFLKIKSAPNFIAETITTANGGSGTYTTEMPNLPDILLPNLDKSSNTGFLLDRDKTYTDIVYSDNTIVNTDYSQKIWLIDGSSRVNLPDATIQKPLTGYPIIILHNQNGTDVDVYPIAGQTIAGSTSFKLKTRHTAWFVPYNGVWTILFNNNTNAG